MHYGKGYQTGSARSRNPQASHFDQRHTPDPSALAPGAAGPCCLYRGKDAYDAAIRPASSAPAISTEIAHAPEQEKMRKHVCVLGRRADAIYEKLAAKGIAELPPGRILEAALANYNCVASGRAAAYSLLQLSLAAVARR